VGIAALSSSRERWPVQDVGSRVEEAGRAPGMCGEIGEGGCPFIGAGE
jgi:hypothetical protein